jgi:hypothetical protein
MPGKKKNKKVLGLTGLRETLLKKLKYKKGKGIKLNPEGLLKEEKKRQEKLKEALKYGD